MKKDQKILFIGSGVIGNLFAIASLFFTVTLPKGVGSFPTLLKHCVSNIATETGSVAFYASLLQIVAVFGYAVHLIIGLYIVYEIVTSDDSYGRYHYEYEYSQKGKTFGIISIIIAFIALVCILRQWILLLPAIVVFFLVKFAKEKY